MPSTIESVSSSPVPWSEPTTPEPTTLESVDPGWSSAEEAKTVRMNDHHTTRDDGSSSELWSDLSMPGSPTLESVDPDWAQDRAESAHMSDHMACFTIGLTGEEEKEDVPDGPPRAASTPLPTL